MRKSCKYCGGIHEMNYECPAKPKKTKYNVDPEIRRFRNSKAWKMKRKEIKDRDLNMCQICIRELYDTINKYTFDQLSVHHTIPLATDWSRRLDNDILITLCSIHHDKAEDGIIPVNVLLEIIKEQEAKSV